MTSGQYSGSDEDFHSLSHHEPEHDGDDELDSVASDDLPPVHPVPALQGAFEESIIDASEEARTARPASLNPSTAESRRQELLEREQYDDNWRTRWKQKPSASFHPLMKLMAQIIFGMHLLHHRQAKSDAEVVKILQTHVDSIDAFLETTTDDLDLAIKDIQERITFLRLPMTHLDVFDIMLDDKKFRTQLVEGNDKIEDIIERTARAMNAAILDVDKGIIATQELGKYLENVQRKWPQDDIDQAAILAAMRGNDEGWQGCLRELQMKNNTLSVALVQLGTVIGEMSKLAAVASRRNKVSTSCNDWMNLPDHKQTQGHNRNSAHDIHVPRSKYANDQRPSRHLSVAALHKPLPQEPNFVDPAVQATLLRPHSQRHSHFEHGTDAAPTTHSRSLSLPSNAILAPSKQRARASVSGKEARGAPEMGAQTDDLANFLRHSGPLKSNPPRRMPSVSQASGGASNDSAYSSGSDPQAELRRRKLQNTPARFGLFPDSKPATPQSASAQNSIRKTSHTPAISPSANEMQWSPVSTKRSSFSIRNMFHRRSKSNLLVA